VVVRIRGVGVDGDNGVDRLVRAAMNWSRMNCCTSYSVTFWPSRRRWETRRTRLLDGETDRHGTAVACDLLVVEHGQGKLGDVGAAEDLGAMACSTTSLMPASMRLVKGIALPALYSMKMRRRDPAAGPTSSARRAGSSCQPT